MPKNGRVPGENAPASSRKAPVVRAPRAKSKPPAHGYGIKKPNPQGHYLYGHGPVKAPPRGEQRWQPTATPLGLLKSLSSQPSGGVVQGKKASDLELRCYNTLKRLGWNDSDIEFQVSMLGGRSAGGMVLDFVVWAPGQPIVISVNGDYWHNRGEKQQQATAQYEARVREAWKGPLTYLPLMSGDLIDDSVAYMRLVHAVGRN